MQCDKCKIKKICKVYDFIKEHSSQINFSIQCNYIQAQNMDIAILNKERQSFDFSNDTFETEEAIPFLLKEKKKKKKIVKCKSCNGTDYEEYINKCYICNREVCGNCGTSSDGKIYCEECWNNNNKQSIINAVELTLKEEGIKDENH